MDILSHKLTLLRPTQTYKDLSGSLSATEIAKKVASTGDNLKIIKSMSDYQKFIKDNFNVVAGLFTTKSDVEGTKKKYPSGTRVRLADVSSILDNNFEELKQYSPNTDDGRLHILAGDVANLISKDFKKIKESKLRSIVIEEIERILNA